MNTYLPTSKTKFQGQGALGKTTPITTPLKSIGNRSSLLPKGRSVRKYMHFLYKHDVTPHYYVTFSVTVMTVCGDYYKYSRTFNVNSILRVGLGHSETVGNYVNNSQMCMT